MKILQTLTLLAMVSCGYDGSVGKLKKDLEDKPASTESAPEAANPADSTTNQASDITPEDEVTLLTEVDFVESCTPGKIEGDFAVSVMVDGNTKFTAFFDDSKCNTASIDFKAKVVEGGVCSNEGEFRLFYERDVDAVRLVIARQAGQIHWEVFDGEDYQRMQYLTIKADFEGPVSFCKSH